VAYRHVGYQQMKHLTTINRAVSVESKESQWVDEVMQVIDEVVVSPFPFQPLCTVYLF